MVVCDLTEHCGFFRDFSTSEDPVCIGFIAKFCKGPDADRCARKRYLRERQIEPPPEMMPSGRYYRY